MDFNFDIGAGIGAGVNLGTSILGFQQGQKDRWQQEHEYQEQMKFGREQFDYSVMQDARNFQEMVRQFELNRPQNKVKDMIEAGLHPTLAAGSSGPGTPASTSQQVAGNPGRSPRRESVMSQTLAGSQMALATAQIYKTLAETKNIDADTEAKKTQPGLNLSATDLNKATTEEIKARLERGELSPAYLAAQIDNLYTQSSYYDIQYRSILEQTITDREMAKLEYSRLSYNLEKQRQLGVHENMLSGNSALIAEALRTVMHGGQISADQAKLIHDYMEADRQRFNKLSDQRSEWLKKTR